MTGIKVNLLPSELLLERRQGHKLILISRLSIGLLVLLIFLTSVTFSLRLSQRFEIKTVQDNLTYAQGKVEGMQSKESQLLVLKNRLSSIQAVSGGDMKRREIFNLLTGLMSKDLEVSELSIDRAGQATLSLSSNNLLAVEELFNSLRSTEKNGGLVSKVSLEGMALGKDASFRFNLKVATK